MADKLLRGKEALTMWRGANGGPGGYLYRGGLLDPALVDDADADRLVDEGFLERVVRDGEQFRLAEDTPTGSKGDPVTVGDNGFPPADETDIGNLNSDMHADADTSKAIAEARVKAAGEAEDVVRRRAEAKAKLPVDGSAPKGTASKDVFVEYLAGKGYSYPELVKHEKPELVDMAKTIPA